MPVSANGTKSIASNAATRSKSKAGGTGPGGSGGVRSGTTTNSNTNRSAGAGGQGNTKMGNSTQSGGLLGSKTTTPLGGQGNVNTQSAFSKMNNSTQSGMGFNAPAAAKTVGGLLGVGGTRGSFTNPGVTSMLGEAQRRNKSNIMESQYSQYRSPPSVNQMAPQAVTDPYGGMGKMGFNSGQTSPYNQPVKSVTDPYGGMGKMGLNSGQTSPYAAPQGLQSNLGYKDPQSQQDVTPNSAGRYGVPGQSQLGYRSLANAVTTIGGTPEQQIDSVLKNMGYDNPLGRAAAIGRFGHETGNFDPNVFSGQRMGDEGTAYGLAQWRGPRQTAAKAYAGQMGIDPANVAGQAAFAGKEMKESYPKAYGQVQGAKTIADAMLGMNRYEAPRGQPEAVKTGNPNLVSGYADSMNRAQQFASAQPAGPTQVASISPTVAPPSPQQAPTITDTPAGSWMDALPGAEYAKQAISYVDEKLVQPTQEQIAKYGGFERAGKLAQAAVGIMNAFGNINISPGSFGPGGGDRNNGAKGLRDMQEAQAAAATPPVTTPPVTPPVNPQTPWLYPQYQSTWANIPTGQGGVYGRV